MPVEDVSPPVDPTFSNVVVVKLLVIFLKKQINNRYIVLN